jgi:hypothetical protein
MRTASIAVLALLAGTASADVVIGNFNVADGVGTAFGGTSTTIYKAAGFTMPAGSYTLDNVRLTLVIPAATAPGVPRVSIYDGATTPNSPLIVLQNPPLPAGTADFTFTPAAPFTLQGGTTYWVHVQVEPTPAGTFSWQGTSPSTLPTGAATFVNYIFNGNPSTFRNRLEVNGTPVGGTTCYPNCDGSTIDPILNVGDFACFLNAFANGDSYANCDGSTIAPVLNVGDFSCFLNAFAAGCS